jgi:hypothetical protein
VVFKSLIGVDADYLHINIASLTVAKSAGLPIAGFTDDYDSHSRAATPDIGADEFKTITLSLPQLNISGNTITFGNNLTWASNLNGSSFEVWKSTNGSSFNKVASLNYNSNGQYQYIDYQTTAPNNYYKVKQIDANGSIVWSNIVLLKNKISTTLQIESLYPNPTANSLNVLVGSPKVTQVSLLIFDNNARLIKKQPLTLQVGQNNTQIDVSALSKGLYILKLVSSNGEQVATSSFLKQ